MDLKNSLVINSAYEEPTQHLEYDTDRKTYKIVEGRRIAGYKFIRQTRSKKRVETSTEYFVPLDLVNQLRPLIKSWREENYQGISPITRKLLEHWKNPAREKKFFFCQLEAIETLIYLTEIEPRQSNRIKIPSDGQKHFDRICTKLCTGGGKTIVMAMLIAYMILNKNRFKNDTRFSKYILIIAPNLTVRDRLLVLDSSAHKNSDGKEIPSCYQEFDIIPTELQNLFHGEIHIINWQKLLEKNDKPAVDKRGAKSDEAYLRDVDDGNLLRKFKTSRNFIVINDEAHHAWRIENPDQKTNLKGDAKKEYESSVEEATVWISGLDRIHRARKILRCFDFSATPYIPSSRKDENDQLFGWIVSDFGLHDGIESGIVKTPTLVYDSDGLKQTQRGGSYKSKLFHIYREDDVDKDLGDIKKSEDESLPQLVRDAYALLGASYKKSFDAFEEQEVPPVMITVASNTSATARIKYSFDNQKLSVPNELCDPELTIRIDSKILNDDSLVENSDKSKLTASDELREKANTVGKAGKLGQNIRNVISVGMLSEGWDARNVTQIMGLRAFSSQLLCEQVLGRGLRRMSYDLIEGEDLFQPEYVNVFGIPINILPTDDFSDGRRIPPPSKPAVRIYPMLERKLDFEILIPNVMRVDKLEIETLSLDWEKIPDLTLQTTDIATRADLGATLDEEPDSQRVFDLIFQGERLQSIIFKTASEIFDRTSKSEPRPWQIHYTKVHLLVQIVRLVQDFLESDKLKTDSENVRIPREVLYALKIEQIVMHVWDYILGEEGECFIPSINPRARVISTSDMIPYFTRKTCKPTQKSHISHVVSDSSWEDSTAYILDHHPNVVSWVKNDHLGFSIPYYFEGGSHRYIPDFVVKLDSEKYLVLETKGMVDAEATAKMSALNLWIKAVNEEKEFGTWSCAMSRTPQDVYGIIESLLQNQ